MVPDANARDTLADPLDDAGALVPENHRAALSAVPSTAFQSEWQTPLGVRR